MNEKTERKAIDLSKPGTVFLLDEFMAHVQTAGQILVNPAVNDAGARVAARIYLVRAWQVLNEMHKSPDEPVMEPEVKASIDKADHRICPVTRSACFSRQCVDCSCYMED